MMGVGVLSIIYRGYKIIISFGTAIEAGFKNQFPTDYLCCLLEVTGLFEQHDFTKGDLINAGSDKPGIKMNKRENEVEIYLDSPLDESLPLEIEIALIKQSFKIRIPTRMSDENKTLLSGICTTMNI